MSSFFFFSFYSILCALGSAPPSFTSVRGSISDSRSTFLKGVHDLILTRVSSLWHRSHLMCKNWLLVS